MESRLRGSNKFHLLPMIEGNDKIGVQVLKNVMHILLIDDNPMDVELAVSALKEVDSRPSSTGNNLDVKYTISVVMNGEEALDYVSNRCSYEDQKKYPLPNIILLDLKMPGVDGCDVLRHIKQMPYINRVPVVMLSSSAEKEDRMRSYEAGASSYLVKPTSFESFTDMMAILLSYWGRHNVRPRV